MQSARDTVAQRLHCRSGAGASPPFSREALRGTAIARSRERAPRRIHGPSPAARHARRWSSRRAFHALHEQLESGIVFLPIRKSLRADPHPYYRKLRERDPVHRSRIAGGWVLSRHADVLDGAARPDVVVRRTQLEPLCEVPRDGRAGRHARSLRGEARVDARIDPPDHTRLRALVSKAFTPRAVERMRPRVTLLVDELLAQGRVAPARWSSCDDFAAPLPVIVIAELIGDPGGGAPAVPPSLGRGRAPARRRLARREAARRRRHARALGLLREHRRSAARRSAGRPRLRARRRRGSRRSPLARRDALDAGAAAGRRQRDHDEADRQLRARVAPPLRTSWNGCAPIRV